MSSNITSVRKRNGSVVPFDSEKITQAIQKAFIEVTHDPHEEDAQAVTETVVADIEAKSDAQQGDYTPSVEEIQDFVERAIMERGFYDVGKAYIIYRFEHAKIREHEKEEAQEKIERSELVVEKRNGEKELFSIAKLKKAVEGAAKGYEKEIDVDKIVEQCRSEIFDGITTKEIARAVVLSARSFIERDPAYAHVASRLLFHTVVYKDVLGSEYTEGLDREGEYRKAFVRNMKEGVERKLVDERILDFDLERMAAYMKPERDDLLRYLGAETLLDRYFLRDKSDKHHHRIIETPQIMWMRIAMGLAIEEDKKEERAEAFYDILSTLRLVSSTPTLFHAGTPHAQLSSCYLGVTDDSLESIYKTYKDVADLSKWSGGIGWAWNKVRATGARVKTTQIESQGVIPFLKIQDSSTVAINRSGRRRGAACMYIEPWHFDVEDFIELRKNTGDERRRTHELNTANWIPDLFMKRVRDNEMWSLFSPDETPDLPELYGAAFEKKYHEYEQKGLRGELAIFKQIKAADLWKKIIVQLFETGHPWITFKDPSNVRSPQDHAGVVHSSNLCTEITLNTKADEEVAVCNLGSVNLRLHMTEDGKLDQEKIKDTVMTGMRMLDNVISINFYPIKEARTSNMRHRPVGLGVMGLQDALFIKGITFDSDEAVTFADESMEMISYYAILGSSQLAKERGTYQSYKGSKWDRNILPVDTLDLLEKERGEKVLVDRTERMDWAPVRESIKKYGMRNSNCMAIAPTATISNIAGCFPTIEPIYKNIYVKANISGNFIVMNHYLVEDLKGEGLWNDEMLELIKAHEGNLEHISSVPQWIKEKHKEVFQINPQRLVQIAAHRGKWIDQSQSLNIFYNGSSGKELSEVYFYAWQTGLKTTYYLRTLGASSIEQSTVAIAKQKNLEKKDAAAAAVEGVKQQLGVEEKPQEPAPERAEKVATKAAPKLCAIEDPSCESCQ